MLTFRSVFLQAHRVVLIASIIAPGIRGPIAQSQRDRIVDGRGGSAR